MNIDLSTDHGYCIAGIIRGPDAQFLKAVFTARIRHEVGAKGIGWRRAPGQSPSVFLTRVPSWEEVWDEIAITHPGCRMDLVHYLRHAEDALRYLSKPHTELEIMWKLAWYVCAQKDRDSFFVYARYLESFWNEDTDSS